MHTYIYIYTYADIKYGQIPTYLPTVVVSAIPCPTHHFRFVGQQQVNDAELPCLQLGSKASSSAPKGGDAQLRWATLPLWLGTQKRQHDVGCALNSHVSQKSMPILKYYIS